MANVTVAGNIFVVDNPESDGSDSIPHEHKHALLIEFDSVEEIREAMDFGEVKFTVFGD